MNLLFSPLKPRIPLATRGRAGHRLHLKEATSALPTFILLVIGLLSVILASYAILAQLVYQNTEDTLAGYSQSLSQRVDSSMSAHAIDQEIARFKHYHPDTRVSVVLSGSNRHLGDYVPVEEDRHSGRVKVAHAYPGEHYAIAQSENGGMHVVVADHDPNLLLLRVLFGIIALIGVGSLSVAWVVRSEDHSPHLEGLQESLDRMQRERVFRPVPVSARVEDEQIARISQSINLLLKECHDHGQRFAQLMADAGHELKTPLTALRINMELLVEVAKQAHGSTALSSEETQELEDSIRAQLDELTRLIDEVVDLSRHDAEEVLLETLHLDEVVASALSRARPRARAHEISLDTKLIPWQMKGNYRLLERMVLNLVDNAVKWSPRGAKVHVHMVEINPDAVMLMVADHGCGIPVAERPQVFNRYYRCESVQVPGTGLGLPICQQVVEVHGGSIQLWATNPLDVQHPGLTVSVLLPRG